MEKRKVITCVYSAIEDGTIKGDMSDNHKEFVFFAIAHNYNPFLGYGY